MNLSGAREDAFDFLHLIRSNGQRVTLTGDTYLSPSFDFSTYWDDRASTYTFSTPLVSGSSNPTLNDLLIQSNNNVTILLGLGTSIAQNTSDINTLDNAVVKIVDFSNFWDQRVASYTFSTALHNGTTNPTLADLLTQTNQSASNLTTLDHTVNVTMAADLITMNSLISNNINQIATLSSSLAQNASSIATLTTDSGTHTSDIATLTSSVGVNASSISALTNTVDSKFDKTGGDVSGSISVNGDVEASSMTSSQTTFLLRGGANGITVTGPQPAGIIHAKINGTGIETPYALTAASASIQGDITVGGTVSSTRICANFILDQNTLYSWADTTLPLNTSRYNSGNFSASSGFISIGVAGLYQIDYHVTTDITSGIDRTQTRHVLVLNGTWLPQTRTFHYNRELTRGFCTSSMSLILPLAAFDVIEVQGKKWVGSSTVQAIEAGLTLIKL